MNGTHEAAIAELEAALQRWEPEPEHTRHVAHLALRLFDQTEPVHGLGGMERTILLGAAWLHDIGWPVSRGGSGHHKHSARMIREHPWEHLTAPQVEVLAQVARYHRRALPSLDHREFRSLAATEREVVRRLAALLRLADALDRSHLQRVRDVVVQVEPKRLNFTLVSLDPPAREIAGAQRKGDLAREVFRRDLHFNVKQAAASV